VWTRRAIVSQPTDQAAGAPISREPWPRPLPTCSEKGRMHVPRPHPANRKRPRRSRKYHCRGRQRAWWPAALNAMRRLPAPRRWPSPAPSPTPPRRHPRPARCEHWRPRAPERSPGRLLTHRSAVGSVYSSAPSPQCLSQEGTGVLSSLVSSWTAYLADLVACLPVLSPAPTPTSQGVWSMDQTPLRGGPWPSCKPAAPRPRRPRQRRRAPLL
jgi:hypothetical protein